MNNDDSNRNKENSTQEIVNSLEDSRDHYYQSFQTPTGPRPSKIARTQSEILLPRRILSPIENSQGIF